MGGVCVQVRTQLQQELNLKQEAFLEVERLQGRLSDVEAALSRSSSTTAGSRSAAALVDVARFHTSVQQVLECRVTPVSFRPQDIAGLPTRCRSAG